MSEEKIREYATKCWRVVMDHHRGQEIDALCDIIRAAIKESSEEKDEVIRRLSTVATDSDSIVGACDCMAKTPDIQHHKRGCKYRLIMERDEARKTYPVPSAGLKKAYEQDLNAWLTGRRDSLEFPHKNIVEFLNLHGIHVS